MRIQEMRSGIAHLKIRMDEDHETSAGASAVDDAVSEVQKSRLDDPVWAVISFDGLQAGGLTYEQAQDLMFEFDAQGVAGLCVVTDEAATRITA